MTDNKPTLSIITATYNAAHVLPNLMVSLRAQTDQDFEWVVMDGASSDGTQGILEEVRDLRLVYRSEPDFGIYDALNKAIKLSAGDYYLVLGADDLLEPTAVENYRAWAGKSRSDIVTAAVRYGSTIKKSPEGASWLRGQMAFVTSHAVGSIFRKSLHAQREVGFYSRAYPIAADQLFILRAVKQRASVTVADFCAGSFGMDGVSSSDTLGVLTEFFRIQMQFESRSLQLILFVLRLLKHSPRLIFCR